ncbi:MAG: acyl-CoA thioesterase [Hyphomonadaceae bacterium]|nr:acyl-CoA thioesterase [Hyphomonadaceae bacterium]
MTSADQPRPQPRPQFSFEAAVTPAHIDELGHVNHKVYVAWAEEAGVRHWRSVAPPALQQRYVWVASRLEMDFLRETLPGDRVRVETWLGALRGARFDRHVRIVGADGVARARAQTTWALLDGAARRPVRVTPDIVALFGPGDDGATTGPRDQPLT